MQKPKSSQGDSFPKSSAGTGSGPDYRESSCMEAPPFDILIQLNDDSSVELKGR